MIPPGGSNWLGAIGFVNAALELATQIENGEAQAGDTLERVATGDESWTVARTFGALIGGKGTRDEFEELSQLEALAPKLRTRAQEKL